MDKQLTIIEPDRSPFFIDFKELYRYRELLWTLAYRDLRVKYAQTAIGLLWAVLNPLLTLAVLTFVFGVIAKIETPGKIPHILYTLAGMCGWTYFATVVGESGNSIINAENMVKKIYFPRLLLPLSKAVTAMVDLAIVLACLLVMMIYYGLPIKETIVCLQLYLLVAIVAGLAGGVWLSALTIRFRDFKHIVPLILRLGMYATPIAYPTSAVPEKYQAFFFLNPLAGVIEGFRWSLFSGNPPNSHMHLSFIIVFVMLGAGVIYFNRMERVMPDIL